MKQLLTAVEEQQQEFSEALLELHTALLLQGPKSSGSGGGTQVVNNKAAYMCVNLIGCC